MLDRDQSLDVLRKAYRARVDGDKEALGRYWAPDAHFEIVGDPAVLNNVPLTAKEPMEAISALIDRFEFSDLEMLDALVEDKTLAVRWSVTLRVQGKDPVRSQLFDLVKLDEEGRIASLTQFADTALVKYLAS